MFILKKSTYLQKIKLKYYIAQTIPYLFEEIQQKYPHFHHAHNLLRLRQIDSIYGIDSKSIVTGLIFETWNRTHPQNSYL